MSRVNGENYDGGNYDPPAPIATVILASNQEAILELPDCRECEMELSMLLDTGADVSVVPKQFIEQLEALLGRSLAYGFREVVDIFGNSRLTKAYRLKVKNNRYTCFDDEVELEFVEGQKGILGRDFIKQYVIRFDGPGFVWNG